MRSIIIKVQCSETCHRIPVEADKDYHMFMRSMRYNDNRILSYELLPECAADQGEAKNTPSNTDYAAAQRAWDEYLSTYPKGTCVGFNEFCQERLHSVKAQNDA